MRKFSKNPGKFFKKNTEKVREKTKMAKNGEIKLTQNNRKEPKMASEKLKKTTKTIKNLRKVSKMPEN